MPRLSPARRREQLRESYWPGSAGEVWSPRTSVGFIAVPRVLPLIFVLIRELSRKGDPTGVFLDLWCRTFEEGIVSVTDEEAFAFSAGYRGPRAVRTWREHVAQLQELGFIRTQASGNREFGHVLLRDPIRVALEVVRAKPEEIPKGWLPAFRQRAAEIGLEIIEPEESTAQKE
jgi:hypothetical protein